MANYKVVDADQLESDLTIVADAIRERGGTSDQMAFPEGFVSAVDGIPDKMDEYVSGNLTEYYHATLTNPMNFGFCYCQKLKKAEFPELINSGYYGFQHTEALVELIAPKLEIVGECGLACSGLKKADFPLLREIHPQGFNWTPVETFILRRTDVMCTLANSNGMANTAIARGTGYIYVPRKFLSDTDSTMDYRQATNWSVYANQFRALEDYTVDGTTTGELDESKI